MKIAQDLRLVNKTILQRLGLSGERRRKEADAPISAGEIVNPTLLRGKGLCLRKS